MQVEDPLFPDILSRLFAVTGATPVEHRETLLCCGKACRDINMSLDMTQAVFQSVRESGADCLGLICPACFDSFDIGQIRVSKKFNMDYQIPLVYYFQVLAVAKGAQPEEVGLHYHKIMPKSFLQKFSIQTTEVS